MGSFQDERCIGVYRFYRGYLGRMEKKMEATFEGLGFEVLPKIRVPF